MQMTNTTINLESLLDLSARLNESNDAEYILNAALLSLMGKLRIMRACALVPDGDILRVLVAKGRLKNFQFPTPSALVSSHLFEVSESDEYLHSDGFVLCAPVCSRGEVRAVLCLGSNITKTPFDEQERQYLSLVCTIVANALQTAGYVQSLIAEKTAVETRNQLLQTLFEMSNELSSLFTRDQILQTFSFRLMGQLMVSKFALALKDGNGNMELLLNRFPSDFSPEQLEQLHRLRETRYSNDMRVEEDVRGFLAKEGIELMTPLMVKGELRGVLAIGKKLRGDFSEYDVRFIEALGSTVVTALENARLFQEELEKKRLEGELDVARQIQRKLLPDTLPNLPGLDVAATNISSRQVGGDYYDCILLDKSIAHIAIADVSGKGMPASLLMANVQAALRVLAPLGFELPEMVARLNDVVYTNTSADKFVTFFGAHVHVQERVIRYTNAGHNPPYLLRANGEIVELSIGGLILGIMESMIPYQQGEVTLEAGDVVLLYTDGVSEAMNERNEEYGEDKLKQALKHCAGLTAQEILATVIRELRLHVGNAPQSDDITMVVIKCDSV